MPTYCLAATFRVIRMDRTIGWVVTPYINGRQVSGSPGCTDYETDQRLEFDIDDVLRIGVPVTVTARLEVGTHGPRPRP